MDPRRTPTVPDRVPDPATGRGSGRGSGLANNAATVAGGILAGATRQLARARSAPKPLHPIGDVVTGTLTRTGSTGSGVPWLDLPGTDEVTIRLSRAVGLPDAVPDIHGLALRLPTRDAHADVLLANTGLGLITRFVLMPCRDIRSRPLTSLLPYLGPFGPLLLGARPTSDDPMRFELLWSHWLSPWVRFADLWIDGATGPDQDISFDPIANPVPGLEHYEWVRRLRSPAYRSAREESGRA